ncbi:unnamed protein product [Camellia sinensis]
MSQLSRFNVGVLGSIAILVSSFVCLYVFLVLIKLFHKLWLNPIHIQRVLASQGIRGPAYKFIHGNTEEMLRMRTESMSRPMDLSHQIFARLQPHLHSWLKIYGKNFLTWNGPKGSLKKLLGNNLVTSEGEKCSKLWKLANHALYAESLKNMVPAMISSVEMMLERWKQHECEEIEMLTKLGIITSRNVFKIKLPIFRMENVVDECKAFYIAGQETTTTLLAWSVLLLAIHTDWQEEARKEVLELFGQQDPHAEGIPRMKKMNMIINESLRLYPPIINITRKVQRKVKLGQFILPANINVTILTLALHRDPQIWGDDVYLFKPGRFSEGVAKATNNNPAVFLPFGFGQRSCVGTSFAINETKIALSMILQRYAFTLSPTYSHSPVQVLTVRPQYGVQVKLHAL